MMHYGLLRATHSRNPARHSDIVWHTPHFYPHIVGGSQDQSGSLSHKTTYAQAQRGFRLSTLASF